MAKKNGGTYLTRWDRALELQMDIADNLRVQTEDAGLPLRNVPCCGKCFFSRGSQPPKGLPQKLPYLSYKSLRNGRIPRDVGLRPHANCNIWDVNLGFCKAHWRNDYGS